MIEPAEFIALAQVLARLAGLDPAAILKSRLGVDLSAQTRHPEGVEHVPAGDLQANDLAHRDGQLGDAAFAVRVLERPGPLDAGHLDGLLRRRPVSHVIHPQRGPDEQKRHDHQRDRRPEDLQARVAMHLGRLAIIRAAKAQRRVNEQATHDDEHRHRDPEDAGVDADDVAGIRAGAVQRRDTDRAHAHECSDQRRDHR